MYQTNQAKKLAENNNGREIDMGYTYGRVIVVGYSDAYNVIVRLNPKNGIGFGYQDFWKSDTIFSWVNPTMHDRYLYFTVKELNEFNLL